LFPIEYSKKGARVNPQLLNADLDYELARFVARHYTPRNIPWWAVVGANIVLSVVEPSPGNKTTLDPVFSGTIYRTGIFNTVVPPREFSADFSST